MLTGLCELEAEIRKSLSQPHEVAHARLTWWHEECQRLASGAPRHPLTQAMAKALSAPCTQDIAGLVDTAIWDLANATFETRREVRAYCERWAAALIVPAAASAALQADAPKWLALGAALREIELLAYAHAESRSGRLRLPLDELSRAGATPEDLSAPTCPPAAARVLGARHEALRASLAAGVADLAGQPAVRGLLVWVQLAFRLSRQAQRALPGWLPPGAASGWGCAWAAWRAARAAERGTLRLQ